MDWKELYKSRTVSPGEAVKAVRSGDRIFLTGNCSVPREILSALVARAQELENVEIYQALTITGSDYVAPGLDGHLRVNSMFISPNVRPAINEGRADYTPIMLSELPLLFKNKIIPLDLAFVHLSPPNEEGFCSYGIETGLTKSPAESAKMIIAEVNPNMPRPFGDTLIHVSQVDYFIPVDYPLAELRMCEENNPEVIEAIAGHIAELIPDGATLQMGIGAIPDMVIRFLRHKKDLGIHTELFSDGVMDLIKAGVITGSRKTIHKGKIVAGFVLGSHELYQWVDQNPLIELYRTEYINNPFVIAQNDRMVAINSAIEVDLTGQVCADSIGPRFYSGAGGQIDFIYGSSLANEGLPIIALPSSATLRDGTMISRITPMLKSGAGVVTTRNHVHYVATEFGIVNLYGKSIRQRAQLLISIAHPDFRNELTQKARELHFL